MAIWYVLRRHRTNVLLHLFIGRTRFAVDGLYWFFVWDFQEIHHRNFWRNFDRFPVYMHARAPRYRNYAPWKCVQILGSFGENEPIENLVTHISRICCSLGLHAGDTTNLSAACLHAAFINIDQSEACLLPRRGDIDQWRFKLLIVPSVDMASESG